MVTVGGAAVGSWLSPAAVAQAVGGRVVRSGRSALRVVTDSRAAGPGDLFVALRGERFDAHDFVPAALRAGAAGVVVDRSLPDGTPAVGGFVVRVEDSGRALLDLAREHRRRHAARVVGITGSCGKTTTKDMLGHVLSASMPTVWSPRSYNNHVGVPLSLLAIRAETRAAVVEIGTNAPGEIADLADVAQPDIGIVTCVREAHLEGLGDLAGVAREKADLLRGLRHDGVAILNGDDPACSAMADGLESAVRSVRVGRPADWYATDVEFGRGGSSFVLRSERLADGIHVELPRVGEHNVLDALLCVAAAVELGVAVEAVVAALADLPQSARRLQPKSFAGVRVFDDTYNMNPASARAALRALAGIEVLGRRIVVFGGMLELGATSIRLHRELGAEVARSAVDLLVTVGSAAGEIADGAIGAGLDPRRVARTSGADQALAFLAGELSQGDQVLFKASRGVSLDRLVDELERALASRTRAGGAG